MGAKVAKSTCVYGLIGTLRMGFLLQFGKKTRKFMKINDF